MTYKNIILLLLFALSFVGCSNDIEHLISGQWQLKSIEENGKTTPVDTVFFSFQRGKIFALTVLINPDESRQSYGYLDKVSETGLAIQISPHMIPEDVICYGWNPENNYLQLFSVVKQNSKTLILSANEKTYSFKKF